MNFSIDNSLVQRWSRSFYLITLTLQLSVNFLFLSLGPQTDLIYFLLLQYTQPSIRHSLIYCLTKFLLLIAALNSVDSLIQYLVGTLD